MIWVIKWYDVEIVMSEAVSIERRKMIKAFGWKIILTDANLWTDWAIVKARELVKKYPKKYFMPDQYSNKYNKLAHYETTAKEILTQTWWKIDYLVSALGTSWTIMGIWKYLKEKDPKIKIVCAEPVLWHYIQGLKNMKEALVPAIYNPKKIDINIIIESEEAFKMARQIAKKEWILVWMSSWAAMLAAIKLAKKIKSWVIVVIFPDRWEKYLSTWLFK